MLGAVARVVDVHEVDGVAVVAVLGWLEVEAHDVGAVRLVVGLGRLLGDGAHSPS